MCIRDRLEAINAGKTALHTVNEVLETLDNAEGWSTWDVMGGGLMADLAKYEELDDAQEQIEQLQVELRRFKTEPVSYTHLDVYKRQAWSCPATPTPPGGCAMRR